MAVVPAEPLQPIVDDPDDYRPASRWRLAADPGDAAGRVDTLTLIVEEIAPGDRIPLHRHQIDELIVILSGSGEVRLEDSRSVVDEGDAVFVPAGAAHGTTNIEDAPLRLHAVFPSPLIRMEMLERNPAPGAESRPPAHTEYDARTGSFRALS